MLLMLILLQVGESGWSRLSPQEAASADQREDDDDVYDDDDDDDDDDDVGEGGGPGGHAADTVRGARGGAPRE